LAKRYGQGPVSLQAICAERDLPKEYLSKIFASLARANLIEPIRGKHGGYMLARGPDQISILDVIEAVEGPIALNFCQHTPPKCDNTECALRQVWTKLQNTFRRTLGEVTLADCTNGRV